MLQLLSLLATSVAVEPTATPSPSDTGTVDPNLVTPGPWGFAIVAIIAVAVIFLIWDMLRRIRRGRYRSEIREELDAEERAEQQGQAASRAAETDDEAVDPGEGAPPRA